MTKAKARTTKTKAKARTTKAYYGKEAKDRFRTTTTTRTILGGTMGKEARVFQREKASSGAKTRAKARAKSPKEKAKESSARTMCPTTTARFVANLDIEAKSVG